MSQYQFYTANKAKFQIAKKEQFMQDVREAYNRAYESGDNERADRYQLAIEDTEEQIKELKAHIVRLSCGSIG